MKSPVPDALRRLFLVALGGVVVVACSAGASSTPPSPTGQSTGAVTTSPAGPTPSSAGSAAPSVGHVIHVNLYVPLASNVALGSACDAAALAATGPVSATIPGSSMKFQRITGSPFVPAPTTAPTVPGASSSAPSNSPVPSEPLASPSTGPAATMALETIGAQTVPSTGTVRAPIISDPNYPSACEFSFDVPTTIDLRAGGTQTVDASDRLVFSVGTVYFPVPLILRGQLEAAGWVANIGVNPQ